ncbi:MAG TPA: hypothetical protein VGQ39_01765 [Pyrinomonadaceae bacterium]|nr:hypothetical protein [Pyrinomonadaceae bacterium]
MSLSLPSKRYSLPSGCASMFIVNIEGMTKMPNVALERLAHAT